MYCVYRTENSYVPNLSLQLIPLNNKQSSGAPQKEEGLNEEGGYCSLCSCYISVRIIKSKIIDDDDVMK